MDKRKRKKLKGTLDNYDDRLSELETSLIKQKKEDRIIGWGLLVGVPLINVIAGITKARFISPAIGPVDIILMITGLRFLGKGMR